MIDRTEHDDTDERVKPLVNVLNALAGIDTVSSCGGRDEPRDGECPADEFYVNTTVDDFEGMASLAVIAFAAQQPSAALDQIKITVWTQAGNAQTAADSMALAYVLSGCDGADSERLTEAIEAVAGVNQVWK